LLSKEAEAEQKLEILNWISAVTGESINTNEPFEKVLKDGVLLCKYDDRFTFLFCAVVTCEM